MEIIEFGKIGLKLLLDIRLEVLCLNRVQALSKHPKNHQYLSPFFPFLLKIENSLDKHPKLANKNESLKPDCRVF